MKRVAENRAAERKEWPKIEQQKEIEKSSGKKAER